MLVVDDFLRLALMLHDDSIHHAFARWISLISAFKLAQEPQSKR
jgi:hypothetical protein